MDYPNLSGLNNSNSLINKAFSYFSEHFAYFLQLAAFIYLPLLTLTLFQILVYFLKVKNIFSSLILDILSTLFGLVTPVISIAIEPIIYSILTISFIQILKKENTDFTTIKNIFNNNLNNIIKNFVIFFLLFISIQQLIQLVLLFPLSFQVIKQSIDFETLLFSESLLEKINSINLRQIIINLYPETFYFTELISTIVAIIFIKKYYLYLPISIVETSNKIFPKIPPLNRSKELTSNVKSIANKLLFLAIFTPYLVNLINTIIFTKLLGLGGETANILLNISTSKQISLFISGIINLFIYPIIVIAVFLLYLKASQILGKEEKEESIFFDKENQ